MHPKAMTFQLTTTMKILLGEIPALSHHSSDSTKKGDLIKITNFSPKQSFMLSIMHDPN